MKPEDGARPFTREDLKRYGTPRSGETRLWERIQLPEDPSDPLSLSEEHPASFVILGIPEDIGPRANLGQGGADKAWEAFLGKFLNVQSNRTISPERTLLAGTVRTEDLMERAEGLDKGKDEELAQLRGLTAELDLRVVDRISRVVEAGKCPIIVGGGHNNSYGALRGSCEALRKKGALSNSEGMGCLNLDPHADLREHEGRHSGNGFTYAYEEGYLSKYAPIGLHRNYNPESILNRFDRDPEAFSPSYFEDMLRPEAMDKAVEGGLDFIGAAPMGLEIDLDSVAGMAVSAETPSGFHENDLRRSLSTVLSRKTPSYVHIAEGAPDNKADYRDHVGKYIAYLVTDVIRWSSNPPPQQEG